MPPKAFYKEESRKSWYMALEGGSTLDPQHLQLGCLMRIADATEAMAKNYRSLIEERDMYHRWYNERVLEIEQFKNRIAGLRGTITRMKNDRR